jgi:hypothetical protein
MHGSIRGAMVNFLSYTVGKCAEWKWDALAYLISLTESEWAYETFRKQLYPERLPLEPPEERKKPISVKEMGHYMRLHRSLCILRHEILRKLGECHGEQGNERGGVSAVGKRASRMG